MLPLFTEFFVDRKATGKYLGGYFADGFANDVPKESKKALRLPDKCAVNVLVKNSLNIILNTMHDMNSQINSDEDFMFSVLQIAYATLESSEIAEIISASSISSDLRRKLQNMLGDTE